MEHELLLIREIVATLVFAGLCELELKLPPAHCPSIIVRHHRPECHVLVIQTEATRYGQSNTPQQLLFGIRRNSRNFIGIIKHSNGIPAFN